MRLRRLDIIRYGAFADRILDFGDGSNDLHLIVGANEAGKSTTLSAIGDMLWGMGDRPPFAFRYPYGELRLGGLIEHDGDEIEFVRRKTRAASLLTPDETPLSDSVLAPFLGGLDRDAFDRMFGLNHERLRAGGLNMLHGKEDVARVLFEAGTGLSGVNAILASLDDDATGIFAGTARNKPLNIALKERETSLAAMRTATVAPTRWKAITKRLEKAEADHEGALQRTRVLEQRRSALERDQRARPILAKIDARIAGIERLGEIPALPVDAAEVRTDAVAAVAETDAQIGERARKVASNTDELKSLPARSVLIDHGDEITRLADGVALHRKELASLPSIRGRASDASVARQRLLEDSGLQQMTELPSAASRLQAREALDAMRIAEQAVLDAEKAVAVARRKLAIAEQDAPAGASTSDISDLKAALAAASRDSVKSQAYHAGQVEMAGRRATRAFAQLAPWTGTPDALAIAVVPSSDVIEDHRKRLDDIAGRRAKHDDHVATTQQALAGARAELLRMSGVDRTPPTPELLEQTRASRDASIVLLAQTDEGRSTFLADVEQRVRSADDLADRREAEANRVAEHARLNGEIERARLLLVDAPARLERIEDEAAAAAAAWSEVWIAAAFSSAVSPQQLSSWAESRSHAIETADRLLECEREAALHLSGIGAQRTLLRKALRDCGEVPAEDIDLDALIARAISRLAQLEQARDDAMLATSRREEARQTLSDEVADLSDATAARDRAAEDLPDALSPSGLAGLPISTADRALSAFELLAGRDQADRDVARAVVDLETSIRMFEAELVALEVATSRQAGGDPTLSLASLRTELDAARQTERDRERLTMSTAVTLAEIAALEATREVDRHRIAALMAAAKVDTIEALDGMIERRLARDTLTAEIAGLRDELSDVSGGLSEENLRAMVERSTADGTATELADVKRDQQDIIDAISLLAAELSAARAEEKQAANGADAADAAQSAEAARATIIDLSGRYIRARSAASTLRWAINRHRETRQAPLLARAGVILANVTAGRFSRLALDWSQGEEPVIVAERVGGERCAVDGMSEGTRDQLFLALRLAAIEERAADHSMPLVCDDLFITADDERSARLFQQMKELSKATQVIVFTHHTHLERIATAAIGAGQYRIHSMQPS